MYLHQHQPNICKEKTHHPYLASCQLYLVVLAAIRDAPDSLTGLTRGIIVLLVAAPRPVPILNTESNLN